MVGSARRGGRGEGKAGKGENAWQGERVDSSWLWEGRYGACVGWDRVECECPQGTAKRDRTVGVLHFGLMAGPCSSWQPTASWYKYPTFRY